MELRKDYFLNRWCIIATERSKRPSQFAQPHSEKHEALDFFAPGNEHLTPPEIGRIPKGNSWKMRWFPNKFPFVANTGDPNITTHDEYYTFSAAFGTHEVIAETPTNQQLWDLPADDIVQLLKVYQNRTHELSQNPNVKYVAVFKNHGKEAGTSLIHSHTQIATLNLIPTIIQQKCDASKDYCPYDKIIENEKNSHRKCFENSNFVAFTPYASRFSFEIWILPKRHIKNLDEFSEQDYLDCADIMKKILNKLKSLNASFNYYLHYSPSGENLRFHIEVLPRLALWAGFEYATVIIINPMPPEEAAKFYRGEYNERL